jgi:diguanylate cyclase (GGDEF)-like protein
MASFLKSLTSWRRYRDRTLAFAAATALAGICLSLLTGHAWTVAAGFIATSLAFLAGLHTGTAGTRDLLGAAYTDPGTGLATRAVAEHLLWEADRAGIGLTVAVADVDNLNEINTVGHAEGDRYLTTIAQRLRAAAGADGTVVRLGGDEFGILSTSLSAEQLRDTVDASLAKPTVVAATRMRPRVSVGIASTRAGRPGQVLACADAAMQTVKTAGGHRSAVYAPDRDGIPRRHGLLPQLRRPEPLFAPQTVADRPDRLLRLYLTAAEALGVHHALQALHDRWAQVTRTPEATTLDLTATVPPAPPGLADVPARAAWRAAISRVSQTEADRYGALAQRVQHVITIADVLT